MDLSKVTTPEWLSQFKALSDKSISHNVFETYIKGMVCKGPSVVNPISTEENESYVKMCSIPNRLSPNGWSCGMNYEQGIDQIVYTNAMSYVRTGLSFRIGKVN